MRRTLKVGVALCMVAAPVVLGSTSASAAGERPADPGGAERHCVVAVLGERDGELVMGPETCFETYSEAQRRTDIEAADAPRAAGDAALASGTIGVHWSGTSYSGSSITIVGTTCSGGVWRPTGFWDDNIASSYHHCGGVPTRFYDSSSCSGTPHNIYGAAPSLYSMNDRASCVRYG